MANSRVRSRFELALDGKQVIALAVGVTVLVGSGFVLGMNLGRRSVIATAATIAAPRDPLAHLDEPLPVRDDAVELKAHQALTDARPIDKTLPVPQVKAVPVAITPPAAPVVEVSPPPVRTERSAASAESKGKLEPKAGSASSAKKGAYAIQIASLPTRSDAEKVAKKNGSRSPRIVQADVPGKGRVYRVLLGSFESREAAKRQLASLTRAGVQGIVTAVR